MWKSGTFFMRYPPSVLWSDSDRNPLLWLIIFCLLVLFWFELGNEWRIDSYVRVSVAYGHVESPDIFIIVKFLLDAFLVTTNIYLWLFIYWVAFMTPLVLWNRHAICCVISYTVSIGMPHLTSLVWKASRCIFTSSQKWVVW